MVVVKVTSIALPPPTPTALTEFSGSTSMKGRSRAVPCRDERPFSSPGRDTASCWRHDGGCGAQRGPVPRRSGESRRSPRSSSHPSRRSVAAPGTGGDPASARRLSAIAESLFLACGHARAQHRDAARGDDRAGLESDQPLDGHHHAATDHHRDAEGAEAPESSDQRCRLPDPHRAPAGRGAAHWGGCSERATRAVRSARRGTRRSDGRASPTSRPPAAAHI